MLGTAAGIADRTVATRVRRPIKAIRFSAEFQRYSIAADGMLTTYFAEGSTATADALIGADGANSRVRTQYLPHAPTATSAAGHG